MQVETILYLGFDKFALAYIMIFVKGSQDPLEGISKLDALNIISRNQIQTKSFEENLYTSQCWGDLSEQEQNDFTKLFLSVDNQ